MEFTKSNKYEEAAEIIKDNMASEYEQLGLFWDDARKLAQYRKCALWDITKNLEALGFFMTYDNDGTFYLAELHINPRFRNRGFGSKAIAKIKKMAAQQSYSSIRVGAFKESAALRLYESNGFLREKETEYTHELVATT